MPPDLLTATTGGVRVPPVASHLARVPDPVPHGVSPHVEGWPAPRSAPFRCALAVAAWRSLRRQAATCPVSE